MLRERSPVQQHTRAEARVHIGPSAAQPRGPSRTTTATATCNHSHAIRSQHPAAPQQPRRRAGAPCAHEHAGRDVRGVPATHCAAACARVLAPNGAVFRPFSAQAARSQWASMDWPRANGAKNQACGDIDASASAAGRAAAGLPHTPPEPCPAATRRPVRARRVVASEDRRSAGGRAPTCSRDRAPCSLRAPLLFLVSPLP